MCENMTIVLLHAGVGEKHVVGSVGTLDGLLLIQKQAIHPVQWFLCASATRASLA